MKISNKKIKEINLLNVAVKELSKLTDDRRINGLFLNDSPDQWNEDEIILFDLVMEIELKLKEQIIEIINGKTSK